MKAVILAAGKGDRFYPFSHYRPKPMFPVCNRPLLEWVVERIVAAGITEVCIVVGRRHGRIRSHFSDGRRFGCRIAYIEQPEPLGTAHAVSTAAGFIGSDDFLVAYGDLFFEPTVLSQLLDGFSGRSVAAVHHSEELNRRIRVESDGRGNIVNYTWKPRSSAGTALSGLYVFRNDAIQDLGNTSDFITGVQNGVTPPEGHEIADALALMNREGRPAAAVRADGVCFDMDMPWEPQAVCRLAVREMAQRLQASSIAGTARVDPDSHIDGPVFVDEGATISRGARISGPVWIGRNTHVFEGSQIASHTVIGDDCRIGPFAKVSGFVDRNNHITFLGEFSGVILAGGRITHQMQIAGIYGEGAEFGAGTQVGTLRFDDGPTQVDVKGIRLPAPGFSGALFGDYARTGVGTILMPGRIVGPSAMVGPGVVLMNNAPSHKAVILKQQHQEIDWGPEKYDH